MIRMRVQTKEVFVNNYRVTCPEDRTLEVTLNRYIDPDGESTGTLDWDLALAKVIQEAYPGSIIVENRPPPKPPFDPRVDY